MITAEEAYSIAKKYLSEKERIHTSIRPAEKTIVVKNKEILYGEKEGQNIDTYIVEYGSMWGNEERSFGIVIDMNTGEILYTIGPHGPIEELEEQ